MLFDRFLKSIFSSPVALVGVTLLLVAIMVAKSLVGLWMGFQSEDRIEAGLHIPQSTSLTSAGGVEKGNNRDGVAEVSQITEKNREVQPIALGQRVEESQISYSPASRVMEDRVGTQQSSSGWASGGNASMPASGISNPQEKNSGRNIQAATSAQQPSRGVVVSIPAAFGDAAAAGISTPEDLQQVSQIANDFVSNVTASGVSPSSPAYHKVWKQEVNRADEIYRQQFGWQALNNAQSSGQIP